MRGPQQPLYFLGSKITDIIAISPHRRQRHRCLRGPLLCRQTYRHNHR
jgi:hypothetical protein